MKKSIALALILALVFPAVACQSLTGELQPASASITMRPHIQENTPTLVPLPTEPPETATPEETAVPPTETVATPTEELTALPHTPTATNGPSIPAIIDSITLALDTQGEDKKPVHPTNEFTPSSIIHAVVHLKDAPAGTKIAAGWYVVDVPGADPNTQLEIIDVVTDGTRFIDFTLTPKTVWPVGSYKVVITVNGGIFDTVEYSVK